MVLYRCSLLLSLAAGSLFATLSNGSINSPVRPADTLQWSFDITTDTAWIDLYLDRSDTVALDTAADTLLHALLQVDNLFLPKADVGGRQRFADGDSMSGIISFIIPDNSFAPGKYWARIADADGQLVLAFRVLPVANPMRTLSGRLIPAAGQSTGFMEVRAKIQNQERSAWTDSAGNYVIYLDSAFVGAGGGSVKVSIAGSSQVAGYMFQPNDTTVDVSTGSVAGLDFQQLKVPQGVKITLTGGGVPLEDVYVYLSDSATGVFLQGANTDASGRATVYSPTGVFRVWVNSKDIPGYFVPAIPNAVVTDTQFVSDSIDLIKPDTFIVGRITQDGAPVAGNYGFYIIAQQRKISADAVADSLGHIRFPALTSDSTYAVNIRTSDSYDSLPAGYIFEKDYSKITVRLGDTVIYNMIPDTLTNSVSASPRPPRLFALAAPRPNPFRPSVTVPYCTPLAMRLSITVYDLSGRRVAVLLDGAVSAGWGSVRWDGRSESGRPLAAGLYLCRMSAAGLAAHRILILTK